MSSPSKPQSKALHGTQFLPKIRTQYNDTLNFEDSHIAERAMHFKDQQHSNTFEELLDEWLDYREEHGYEEDDTNNMDANDDLPVLQEITKEKTTDEPETAEERILERHIREMLYNIILASHYKMKQRKDKLIHKLINISHTKRSEIIAKYLPTNDTDMMLIINYIFDEIVAKHYHKCRVFVDEDLCKQTILKYIKNCCKLCFEMVISQNELSFFPLLFTDQSSSYIAPVVRYDRIIKKSEKNLQKGHKRQAQSLVLQVMKQNKAKKAFSEGQVYRDRAAVDAEQILYYTFPGVIMKTKNNDKILKKATVFTYHDPSIFLRHDLNWIFSDRLFRKQKMNKWKKDKSVSFEEDDAEFDGGDNIFSPLANDTDPYYKIESKIGKRMEMRMDKVVVRSDVIKNTDFLGKAQLIQDWASLKKQKHSQLCEELCDLFMELKDDNSDSKEEEDEEHEEYECNKLASKILFELAMKSRHTMKLKTKSNNIVNNKNNTTYLNICNLYKYFTDYNQNKEAQKVRDKIDFKHGYIVQSIVNSTFEQVIKKKAYKKYVFLKKNKKLNYKLHEYIASCCELICNVFHHEWDLCPIMTAKNQSLHIFDARIHIFDGDLSMDGATDKIGYCCFPGIITKSCWSQFNLQYGKKKLSDKQIQDFIKSKMWVCLTT